MRIYSLKTKQIQKVFILKYSYNLIKFFNNGIIFSKLFQKIHENLF